MYFFLSVVSIRKVFSLNTHPASHRSGWLARLVRWLVRLIRLVVTSPSPTPFPHPPGPQIRGGARHRPFRKFLGSRITQSAALTEKYSESGDSTCARTHYGILVPPEPLFHRRGLACRK